MPKHSSAKHYTLSIRSPAAVAPKVRQATQPSLAGSVIYAPNFKPTRIGI